MHKRILEVYGINVLTNFGPNKTKFRLEIGHCIMSFLVTHFLVLADHLGVTGLIVQQTYCTYDYT